MIDPKKCRQKNCAEGGVNDDGFCWRHEVGIRLSRAEAAWLMFALGLANGSKRYGEKVIRVTERIVEQLPEAL